MLRQTKCFAIHSLSVVSSSVSVDDEAEVEEVDVVPDESLASDVVALITAPWVVVIVFFVSLLPDAWGSRPKNWMGEWPVSCAVGSKRCPNLLLDRAQFGIDHSLNGAPAKCSI